MSLSSSPYTGKRDRPVERMVSSTSSRVASTEMDLHVRRMGHHIADRLVREVEHIVQQLLLVLIDGAALSLPQVDHHADLILCDLLLLHIGLHAQQAEHPR